LASVLLVGGIIGVVAYNPGGPPEFFGHSAEELDIDFNIQCQIISNTDNDDTASVSCPGGYKLTGGGSHCTGESLVDAAPSGNSYSVDCQRNSGPTTADAVCCRVIEN
jgi:hypothetical protein